MGRETGDISAGIKALVLHYFRVAEKSRIVCGNSSLERAVGIGDADIFNIGRTHRDRHIVAEVIFKIFNAPLGERVRIYSFIAEARGQILAGKRSVG